MKKHFLVLVALLLAVSVAMPAFAAPVDFQYGGLFRARIISQNNFTDGNDDNDDHLNRLDQRLRLYFTFKASENLKLVTKFEANAVWGDPDTYGRVGADKNDLVVKNAYLDFAIPNTPTRATVGVQGINLMNSWIIDDDFSAAVLKTKLEPVVVSVGYIGAQNDNWETNPYSSEDENIDSWFLSVDYADGPLTASLVGYYQMGHDTLVSADPTTLTNPVPKLIAPIDGVSDNNLFDIGLNVGYKLDWMSAYVTFVKNLGSVDFLDESHDYTGWMVDAGFNYFCGPYTFNLGGFYTTGQDVKDDDEMDDIDFFTYPLAATKYFSEIMGGGILDNTAPKSYDDDAFYSGYGNPSNLWTITAGAAWQVMEKTKISASYWYFSTSEDVESGHNDDGEDEFDNSLGHEIDLYVTQGIVDGLTLDLVGAYMFAGDAFSENNNDDDVYELGARLQWSF